MADIQIVYRDGYCEIAECNCDVIGNYCTQCHTQAAEDLGCKYYDEGSHDANVIPFGDCIHALFRRKYKGIVAKKYDIEPFEDNYNMHLNCMAVTAGRKTYYCDKVILNGKCIYNNIREDEE